MYLTPCLTNRVFQPTFFSRTRRLQRQAVRVPAVLALIAMQVAMSGAVLLACMHALAGIYAP